jgi:hypothetical protein
MLASLRLTFSAQAGRSERLAQLVFVSKVSAAIRKLISSLMLNLLNGLVLAGRSVSLCAPSMMNDAHLNKKPEQSKMS